MVHPTDIENDRRPRATRFKLKMPVLYQRRGADRWLEGESVDLSHSGMLFATSHDLLAAGEDVSFIVCLPGVLNEPGGEVHCTGRVARVCLPERDRPLMAVTIDSFVMLPPGAVAWSRRDPPGRAGPRCSQ
ncbi:MAG: PilZ domain-containing protein [Vicinamibacterales bacterium]